MLGKILNVGLMTNPYNWVVVWLMLAIAGAALTFINQSMDQGS